MEEKKNKEDRYYADRSRIVHAVLADRLADRDYGNKPQSNDRIEYIYTIVKGNVELQGDRVETPEYIIENKIHIDYLFYITNQIMKPSVQFLELLIEKPENIFEEYITREENRRKGQRTIKSYFMNIDKDLDSDSDSDGTNLLDQIEEYDNETKLEKKKKKKTTSKGKNIKVKTSDYVNFEETEDGFMICM